MQTVARHDVGLAPENPGGGLLHIHQLKESELSLFVIEEQIDIRILPRLSPRGRSEQVKVLDAEALQLGFMLPELGYGFVASHGAS